jgi:serine phosphatase RsbU (regulator of sigma subunit)
MMDFSVIKAILKRVLFTRSIARNLAIRLAAVFLGVFAIFALLFATVGFKRETARQKERSEEAIRDLVGVLVTPLWTYNTNDIKGILLSMSAAEDIKSIRVFDDEKKEVAKVGAGKGYLTTIKRADVRRKNQVIGHIEMEFSQDAFYWRQFKTWVLVFAALGLLLAISAVSATILLEQHLNRPMIRLIRGLKLVSRGKYDERLPEMKEAELVAISKAFDKMATELANREKALAENVQARTMIDTELALAKTIQQSMVEQCKKSQSLEIIPFYEPASNVSGDWFSTFESMDGRYTYVMMGDVSGHGIPQALITASVLATINALDRTVGHQSAALVPSEITALVRDATALVMQQGSLAMTMLAMRIDHEQHQILVCNAGHTFPLLVGRDLGKGRVRELARAQQSPIGVEFGETTTYTDQVFPYIPGDFLCVYTDGLSGARDKHGRLLHRIMIRALKEASFSDLNSLHEFIITKWRAHGAKTIVDDICLLTIGLEGKNVKHTSAKSKLVGSA